MLRKTLTPEQTVRLKRIRALARLLDDALPIPGTGQRIGLDALLGLLPVAGDVMTALLALYIIGEAAQLGVPKSILLKMLFNLGVDFLGGAIPLAGDVFDVLWRANRKNLALLEDYLQSQGYIMDGPVIEI